MEYSQIVIKEPRVNEGENASRLKFKIKEVESAHKGYLIMGIICVLTFVIAQIIIVVSEIKDFRLGSLIFAELISLLLLFLGYSLIKLNIKRTSFYLYLSELNNDTDIEYIKKTFEIVKMNEDYILYINKYDLEAYNIWKLWYSDINLNSFAKTFT